MEYGEFLKYVEEHIIEYLPSEYQNYTVRIRDYKMDGEIQQGLCIYPDAEGISAGVRISPAIRLGPVYKGMQENKEELHDIMQKIADFYLDSMDYKRKSTGKPDLGIENILNNLFTAVVNYEKTDLHNIPYLRVNDLAVIAKCQVSNNGIITINDKLADYLGMDGDVLLSMAMENNARHTHPELISMTSVCCSGLSDDFEEPHHFEEDLFSMYILTNQNRYLGASLIADKSVLDKVATMLGGDFYMMPSSIHELMVVPVNANGVKDIKELKQLVEDVNRNYLPPEDYLSDNVYMYDSKTKEVKMFVDKFYKERPL